MRQPENSQVTALPYEVERETLHLSLEAPPAPGTRVSASRHRSGGVCSQSTLVLQPEIM